MKKWLIGSLVGAIIVFAWHFLSWGVLGIHSDHMKYHPQQDSIIGFLSSTIKEDGAYMLPTVAPGMSHAEEEAYMEKCLNKPWASVIYHNKFEVNMPMQIARGFLIDLFLVFSLIYILTRAGTPTAMRIFAASIAVGLFCFLWGPYTAHNWFALPMSMIKGDLIDAFAAWGLCGIWLGWWLNRR